MGRLKRRFFLWLHDQIDEAVDVERIQPRRQATLTMMRRTPPQEWFSATDWKASECVWVDTVKDERFSR